MTAVLFTHILNFAFSYCDMVLTYKYILIFWDKIPHYCIKSKIFFICECTLRYLHIFAKKVIKNIEITSKLRKQYKEWVCPELFYHMDKVELWTRIVC